MSDLPVLASERLVLRPVRLSDAEALFAVLSDVDLMTWWSSGPHRTVEETRAYLEPAAAGEWVNHGHNGWLLPDGIALRRYSARWSSL